MAWARKRGGDGTYMVMRQSRVAHKRRAERRNTWRTTVGGTQTAIFTGSASRENGGNVISACVSPERRWIFWLIQADSWEPSPKCSVEEILAFHRIHPPEVPLCPSLSVSPPPATPTIYLTPPNLCLNHCLTFCTSMVFVGFLVTAWAWCNNKSQFGVSAISAKQKRKRTQSCVKLQSLFRVTAERLKTNSFNCHNSTKKLGVIFFQQL